MSYEFSQNVCEVSVVLPTFNEAGNILPLINAISKELSDLKYEIIVVDDNSCDGTGDVVKEYPNVSVKLIVNHHRQGLAQSILIGIKQSTGKSLVIMDSDFNHQPNYLKFMIHSLNYYDCVSASRFLSKVTMGKQLREILTGFFNQFTRSMIGGSMTDYFYGYIAIKRDKLAVLNCEDIFYGYGDYYLRLLFEIEKEGVSILEFAAVNGKRFSGVGNQHLIGVFIKYVKEVFLLAYRLRFKS